MIAVRLWLRILAWTATVYLLLWALTLVGGAREVKAMRESYRSAISARELDRFDPAERPPQPAGKTGVFFFGNLGCPCPLVFSFDHYRAMEGTDVAGRTTYLYLGIGGKVLGHKDYWR